MSWFSIFLYDNRYFLAFIEIKIKIRQLKFQTVVSIVLNLMLIQWFDIKHLPCSTWLFIMHVNNLKLYKVSYQYNFRLEFI